MSGAWAWVWKYVLLCFSFKFWECVDRAYVRWKIVESVWGKIEWGWLKERSVRYRELKGSSLSECASCARFWERGVQKVLGGSFMRKLKAQEGCLVLSAWLQWWLLNHEKNCVMVTVFQQGLPQDDFESPPLEALQTISEMCRELWPGNAAVLYHGADVQTIVQSESRFRERVQRSRFKVCRSRVALESTWLTWAVHHRSEVRTRPRCLCILTFCRVLPLRLITKSEEKGHLVNSIDTVLFTLTASFQSESHADVASTDLCRWPSHSVGDGLTVGRAVSSAN